MYDRSAELYDLFYDWKDYRAEAENVRQLLADRNPHAQTLLDFACGTDEYWSSFEAAGLSVEHGADGLMGRGLWIGRRSGPP